MKCLVIAWLAALPAITALTWPEFSHDELADGAAKVTEQTDQTEQTSQVHPTTSTYFTAFDTVYPPQIFKPTDGLDAIAPICNLSPLAPASVQQSQQNQQSGKNARAIPTNKWWGNLISVDTKSAIVANPAWANPYALKFPADPEECFGLQTCYSYTHRKKADEVNGAIKYYLHEYHNDLTLSAAEFTSKPNYEIMDWNELSVHAQICAPSDPKKCMHADLVQGMAFVTATYVGLTPKFTSEYKIESFKDGGNGKYVMELENKQTWVLYAECKNGESFTLGSDKQSVQGPPNYSGTVRAAVLPSEADATVYDEFAGCIVKSGDVSMHSRTSYSLDWTVEGQTCGSNGLLHFALPHQVDSSIDAKPESKIRLFSTMRGEMAGLVAQSKGNTASWTLAEPEFELDVGFYPPRKPSAEIVQSTKLNELLKEDIEAEWEASGQDESFYFDGKAMQKYASLCLMANDESVVGQDKFLFEKCLTKLKSKFEPFLTGKRQNKLAYDTTYGGIVTDQVFTTGDVGVDFGNGVYNDHHYHYGYWIAAAAILKKLDPSYDNMAVLDEVITTLLRDVANPSSDDIYFPRFRHFSWFLGHSYSHGVTPLADGKDEESTSEDVNFFYGMMLWGMASGNKNIEDLASLMLRIDAHAIRTYFLMTSDNVVHPPEFAKNKVTGIFFDNKADYASWFSAEKYCIHGIQMLPASPITEFVRTQQFVKEEWDEVLSKEEDVVSNNLENTWMSILYVNKASIDVQDAISKLTTVALDDGLTRSWALYFAATRPGNGEFSGSQVQIPTSAPKVTPSVTPMVTPSASPVVTTKIPISTTTASPTAGSTDYTSSTGSQVGMDLEPSKTPTSVPNQTQPEPVPEPSATPNTGVTQTDPTLGPEQNSPVYSCDLVEGDLKRGVASVEDASCAAGGLGCFFGKCRLCQQEKTEYSAHLVPCSEIK